MKEDIKRAHPQISKAYVEFVKVEEKKQSKIKQKEEEQHELRQLFSKGVRLSEDYIEDIRGYYDSGDVAALTTHPVKLRIEEKEVIFRIETVGCVISTEDGDNTKSLYDRRPESIDGYRSVSVFIDGIASPFAVIKNKDNNMEINNSMEDEESKWYPERVFNFLSDLLSTMEESLSANHIPKFQQPKPEVKKKSLFPIFNRPKSSGNL